jgi:hypothetical protein
VQLVQALEVVVEVASERAEPDEVRLVLRHVHLHLLLEMIVFALQFSDALHERGVLALDVFCHLRRLPQRRRPTGPQRPGDDSCDVERH